MKIFIIFESGEERGYTTDKKTVKSLLKELGVERQGCLDPEVLVDDQSVSLDYEISEGEVIELPETPVPDALA